MTGRVYAVASGKGGVGKTTTAVNLGVTLRADDRSVVLVDADLGMANLGTFLGIDHEPTLHDVLAGDASVDDALTEQADRFAVLPGSRRLDRFAAIDPSGLPDVIRTLADRYEHVIVDTGAGVSYEDLLPLELVDEVILITSPDPAALGDAEKTGEIADLIGVAVRGVVVTRADDRADAEAVADTLGTELLAAIPDDPAVPESTAAGQPLEAYAPESPAAEAYRGLAAALTGRDAARFEPPGMGADDEEPAEGSLEPTAGAGDDADTDDRGGADDEGGAGEPETEDGGEGPAGSDEPADEADGREDSPDETGESAGGEDGSKGGVLSWFGRLF